MKRTVILPIVLATSLMGTDYTASSGWNMFGTNSEIAVSKILENTNVKNIVIYRNGSYEYSATNDFSTIPANSGFWLFASKSTTISLENSISKQATSSLKRLDSSLNEVASNATSWDILDITDANLYMEMKTTTYSMGLTYTHDEAIAYCENLQIGGLSDWRLPTYAEGNGINDISSENFEYFLLKDSHYWSSTNYYHSYYYNTSGYSNYDSSVMYAACVHDK